MATRNPLVLVSGQQRELGAGDTLPAAAIPAVVAGEVHAATSKATPVDADELGYLSSATGFSLVRMTWANLTTWLGGLFVGKTGAQSMSGVLTAGGLLSNAGVIGYGVGSGGTATQATNKSTGVTINKFSGAVTMNAEAMGAGVVVAFAISSSVVTASDTCNVSIASGVTSRANYSVRANCAAGVIGVIVKNESGGSLSEAIVIQFNVMKGSTT